MEQELNSKSDIYSLKSSIKRIGWSYIFIYFSLTLGSLDILPGWVGYMMILSEIYYIAEHDKSSLLLKTPCVILIIYEIMKWAGNLIGLNYQSFDLLPFSLIRIVGIIVGIISIYFHFQLLTNLANVAEIKGLYERKSILLNRRTLNTILQTIISFSWILLNEITNSYVFLFLAVVSIIVVISIVSCLFAFSSELEPAL